MAIQNKSITVVGAQTAVERITMFPQADGSVVLTAIGKARDLGGLPVDLKEAYLRVTGVAAVDNLVARALIELRKANDLET